MIRAYWNDELIAESDNTVIVEGHHYFPAETIKKEYIKHSDYKSVCPWKGEASYYSVHVKGKENPNAAWYYPHPTEPASLIKDRIAFWRGVKIQEE